MPVRLGLGRADIEALIDEIEMVQIDEPRPARLAFRAESIGSVPRGFLPVGIGRFQALGSLSVGKMPVHRGLGKIAYIEIVDAAEARFIEIVDLERRMAAPAEHDRFSVHDSLDPVPTQPLRRCFDTERLEQFGKGHRQGLTRRIGRRIVDRKNSPHAVFDADTVISGSPACLVQDHLRLVEVIADGGIRIGPWKSIGRTVGRCAVTEKRNLDKFLPVDAEIDRTPDGAIRGHRIADNRAVLTQTWPGNWKGDPAIVDRLDRQLFETVRRQVRQCSRDGNHVHLARLRRGEARILVCEQEGDSIEGSMRPVIFGIGLDNQLLAPCPGNELVGSGANRIGSVAVAIACCRNDP